MKRFLSHLALLLAAPSFGFAHGQQVLFMPIGQFAAFVVVSVVCFCVRLSWKQRAFITGVPVLLAPVLWFMPGIFSLISEHFGYGPTPWFIFGVLTFLASAGLIFAWIVLRQKSPTRRQSQRHDLS